MLQITVSASHHLVIQSIKAACPTRVTITHVSAELVGQPLSYLRDNGVCITLLGHAAVYQGNIVAYDTLNQYHKVRE